MLRKIAKVLCLRNIYALVQESSNIAGNTPTQNSLENAMGVVQHECGLGPGSRMIALSPGGGTALFHAAATTGCSSFGVYDDTSNLELIALNNQVQLFQAGGVSAIASQVFVLNADITSASILNPFSHLFMLNPELSLRRLSELAEMFNRSASVK